MKQIAIFLSAVLGCGWMLAANAVELKDQYMACFDGTTGKPIATPACDSVRSDFFSRCASTPTDPACSLPDAFVTKIGSAATAELAPARAGQPAAAKPSGFLSLQLPACISTGNCSLDDIVRTGAAFANLLTALSAALFFGTFVYGGGAYLLSFGRENWVKAGKSAMWGATFGMLIVLFAWTLVNYLANAIRGIS